ncbi:hypothetical protein GCM10007036_37210 [Alsobacter metallidurans]|uniref:Lectin-like protein BA14k n=1 Tax=Alsobacter metallidurans TaxID=340221 RepID=A0A917I9J4_9HYPH|nr:BA14K family protein [Alsobacter metallidurans]GGH28164.1 hypothetical protein GCM10007036_37210 [Alsobacter metallidurans]
MSLALPRTSLTMIFAAASLAGASMIVAKPATAAPVAAAPIAQSAPDGGLATQVQWRRHGGYRSYGGYRGGYYGRGYGPRYSYYRRGNNWGGAAAAGIAGLATGAIIGGVLSQPRTTYVEPGYGYGAVDAGGSADYCAQRFRSYDPASGTYLGYDGLRHSCP